MANLHVKKDDTVVVITGKDKGKKGKIMVADPGKGRVIVSGVNMITRHQKAKSQTEPGGIIQKRALLPLPTSCCSAASAIRACAPVSRFWKMAAKSAFARNAAKCWISEQEG